MEKLTTSVFKERQTETVRASFASKWLKHFVEWKISSIEPSGYQQDVEHEEAQFSSHRRSVVSSAVSDNSHPVPWQDCRRDFLWGLLRLSPKLKRLLHKVQCESSVAVVGRWTEVRQRVFVEKEYCNFRVDDVPVSSPFTRMNQCGQWDLPFWFQFKCRRSCPSWHLYKFRCLVHRFSGNKGAGLENTRIAEMFLRGIAIWVSPLPIFLCSEIERISRRIFWFVCSDHASAISALAFGFQRSLLVGFCGISTLSSIESWCVVGEKEHGKETCVFRQHFCFVMVKLVRSEWWSWVRYWK